MVQRWCGTMSWCRFVEWSCWRLAASVADLQQMTRYWGALTCRHRWTVILSINWICWETPRRWSSEWSRCVKPWSNLWVPLTTWAAAFSTCWRWSVVAFDDPASQHCSPLHKMRRRSQCVPLSSQNQFYPAPKFCPKWHLNWFRHFCRAHSHDQHTDKHRHV